jgi:RNA polymerase primary sigma factor
MANTIPFLGQVNAPKQSSFNNRDLDAGIGSNLNLYYKDVENCKVKLTEKETRELIAQAQKGSIEAQNKLTEGYLKLVLMFANRHKGKGVELEDLIQEGNIGLIKAINKFDLNRENIKFISYAGIWIDKNILKIFNNSSIKYSSNIKMASKYLSVKQELNDKFGREPSREEIGAKSGLKINQIVEIEDYLFNKPVYLEEELNNSNPSPSRTRTSKYSDIIADRTNPFEEIIEAENSSSLSNLL